MRRKDSLFREFTEWGYDERGWRPITRSHYVYRVKAANTWLEANRGVSVMFATEKDLKAYLFSCTPSASYRNNIRQALVAFFEFLIDIEVVTINHALGLPRLPQPRGLPKALDVKMAHRIEVAARSMGPKVECLILLMLYGGLRRNETRELTWPDLADPRWIKVTGKGGKHRMVPVAAPLAAALNRWQRYCDDPVWVFPSPMKQGHPLSATWIRDIVLEVGELAGTYLHPHMLRHTAGTRVLQVSGGDIRVAQEFLGHSDPKTTAIYLKVWPVQLEDVGQKMNYLEDEG